MCPSRNQKQSNLQRGKNAEKRDALIFNHFFGLLIHPSFSLWLYSKNDEFLGFTWNYKCKQEMN